MKIKKVKNVVCTFALALGMAWGVPEGAVGDISSQGLSITAEAAKESVKLSKSDTILRIGKTTKLSISGTGKEKVKWSVSKGSVASIKAAKNGKSVTIRGKKAGTVLVTAKVGKKSYSCSVRVVPKVYLNVESKELLPGQSVILELKGATEDAEWQKGMIYNPFTDPDWGLLREYEEPYNNFKMQKIGFNKYKVTAMKRHKNCSIKVIYRGKEYFCDIKSGSKVKFASDAKNLKHCNEAPIGSFCFTTDIDYKFKKVENKSFVDYKASNGKFAGIGASWGSDTIGKLPEGVKDPNAKNYICTRGGYDYYKGKFVGKYYDIKLLTDGNSDYAYSVNFYQLVRKKSIRYVTKGFRNADSTKYWEKTKKGGFFKPIEDEVGTYIFG